MSSESAKVTRSRKLESLAGAAILIAVVTLVSRILGFARSIAQASWVGTGGVAEPYAVANQLPNILFEVVAGGALAGVVIPLLAGSLGKKRTDEASATASALITWTLTALIPLAVLVAVFAPQIIALTSNLANTEYGPTANMFLVIFAVQIPLYGVGVVLGGVLQAHKKFLWPALAPLFSSLVVIVAYFVFGKLAGGNQANIDLLTRDSLGVLAWGTTAGVLAMAIVMIGPVRQLGLKLRPRVTFPAGLGRRARNLALAGIGALLAQQVTMLVVMKVATTYGTNQTFNIFQYSQAVYVLPYAVLVVPLATSTFPRIAALAARQEHGEFNELAARTTKALLVISTIGAAALVAAARPLEAFFATFTRGGVPGMTSALVASAPGLIGFALIFHLSRILYARDNGRAAVIATATGWLVAAALTAALPQLPALAGRSDLMLTVIGGSQSVGMTVAGVLLLIAVARDCGPSALSGAVRTALLALIAVPLGGYAGLRLSAVMLPASGARILEAVGVGLLVALVAAVIVLGLNLVFDRSTIRTLRTLGKRSSAPAVQPETEIEEPR